MSGQSSLSLNSATDVQKSTKQEPAADDQAILMNHQKSSEKPAIDNQATISNYHKQSVKQSPPVAGLKTEQKGI